SLMKNPRPSDSKGLGGELTMARPRKDDVFGPVRQQAARVLATIAHEIQRREDELQHLTHQANAWRTAIGGARRAVSVRARRGRRANKASRAGKRGRASTRVSWAEVLASVPAQFGASDVLKHPGARSKGKPHIYAALSRWLSDGKIKRIATGKYAKGSGAAPT